MFYNQKNSFKLKGFTLIEAVVALFVFLIIMLSLSDTFTQSFTGYRNARAVQKDVENAQFALNLLAKELRTSTIISSSSSQDVEFYDHSQGMCFKYEIGSKELTVTKKAGAYIPDSDNQFNPSTICNVSFPGPTSLVQIENDNGNLTGNFVVIPSTTSPTKSLGKVTTSLQISEGPKHKANVQTTSSLRDYGYIGLIGN